jgi:hypothetical protein
LIIKEILKFLRSIKHKEFEQLNDENSNKEIDGISKEIPINKGNNKIAVFDICR